MFFNEKDYCSIYVDTIIETFPFPMQEEKYQYMQGRYLRRNFYDDFLRYIIKLSRYVYELSISPYISNKDYVNTHGLTDYIYRDFKNLLDKYVGNAIIDRPYGFTEDVSDDDLEFIKNEMFSDFPYIGYFFDTSGYPKMYKVEGYRFYHFEIIPLEQDKSEEAQLIRDMGFRDAALVLANLLVIMYFIDKPVMYDDIRNALFSFQSAEYEENDENERG